MRGSPLLHSLVLLAVLAIASLGFTRLTGGQRSTVVAQPVIPAVENPSSGPLVEARFHLVLSSPAESFSLETGGPAVTVTSPSTTASGRVLLDPAQPHITLSVNWPADETLKHHFAKLTLEAPAQPTFVHVFDSAGDIDDFLEFSFR